MFLFAKFSSRVCVRQSLIVTFSSPSCCWISSRAFDLPSVGTESSKSVPPISPQPLITERVLDKPVYCSHQNHINCQTTTRPPRQAWVDTLNSSNGSSMVGLVNLHPDVFAIFPRLDLVHKNLYWQAHYRMVDWRCITTRAELPYRCTRKPWPQKGTGRARHGNRRTHIWMGGGQCKGPRGPESYFSMLPRDVRIAGLLTMLTVKHTQNDLHIVDNFNLSDGLEVQAQQIVKEALEMDADPEDLADSLSAISRRQAYNMTKAMNDAAIYVRELIDDRRWGPSVLFVTEDSPDAHLHLPIPGNQPPSNEHQPNIDWTKPPASLAINLACTSYANHIEAEISPEASAYWFESITPRVTHPGRGLTVLPLHGLNVWSLAHHDTVVLSLGCLDLLENRLLNAQRTLIRDQSLERVVDNIAQPSPADWLSSVEYEKAQHEENDSIKWPSGGHRHFSGNIDSPYWQRLKLS